MFRGLAGLVASGVESSLTGLSTPCSRNDVISHIERIRDRQTSCLCNSMGALLRQIVHPPRSLADTKK